jgi:8-oxo-dGTP diphosphatase
LAITTTPPVHVAAGVIRRHDGAILLSLRPRHAHQGGLWEFPGGKIEPHETVPMALARELNEELGIRVGGVVPLIRIHHEYADKHVLLDVQEVRSWTGEPHGREGQEVRWVQPDALDAYRFPAANLPVLTAARLPGLALHADLASASNVTSLARALAHAIECGLRLLCLILPAGGVPPVVTELLTVCRAQRALCTVARRGRSDEDGLGNGLHLPNADLRVARPTPRAAGRLLSATCRSLDDLRHAASLGVDFAYLDLPAGVPTGMLRAMTEAATLPVFAAGSMRATDAGPLRRLGCQGIALEAVDALAFAEAADTVRAAETSVLDLARQLEDE